jgi:spoIIIJ-associated protein
MPSKKEFEGADLDETLSAASESLGISKDAIHYRLLDEGRRGVFGLGARSVRILVEVPAGPAPVAPEPRVEVREREPEPVPEPPPEPEEPEVEDEFEEEEAESGDPLLDDLAATVNRMMGLMNIRLAARAASMKGGARLEMRGKDRKVLLNKDAEFLNALQFLLNRMSRRAWPGVGRIQIVCEGHRNRRDGELVEEIHEVAGLVSRTGRTKRLQPMNPYERRLVHLTIREYPDLETRSEGDGFMKTVKVRRKQEK